jgi:hypothetical protein
LLLLLLLLLLRGMSCGTEQPLQLLQPQQCIAGSASVRKHTLKQLLLLLLLLQEAPATGAWQSTALALAVVASGYSRQTHHQQVHCYYCYSVASWQEVLLAAAPCCCYC